MSKEIILAILGSSLLTGIVTSLFSKFSKDKDNKLQYITEERKKWRDDLRYATLHLRKLYELLNNQYDYHIPTLKFSSYAEIKTFFQVRLNPNDDEDNKIMILFDGLISKSNNNSEKISEIEEAIAILLKFDWERAKTETKPKKINYFTLTILLTFLYLMFRKTDIVTSNPFMKYLFSRVIEWETIGVLLLIFSLFSFYNTAKYLLEHNNQKLKFIIISDLILLSVFCLFFFITYYNYLLYAIIGYLSLLVVNHFLLLDREADNDVEKWRKALCTLLKIPYRKLIKNKKN